MGKVKEWRGRPTKFTPDCIMKLKEILKIDGTIEEACSYAGVSPVNYYMNLKRDENFRKEMEQAKMFPKIFAKRTVFRSMQSKDEKIALKASIEYLSRRNTDRSTKVENTVKDGGTVSEEDKEILDKIIKKRNEQKQ